jgi:hypothetical protein
VFAEDCGVPGGGDQGDHMKRLRRSGRRRTAFGTYAIIAVLSSLLTLVVLLSYVYLPKAVAGITGVPEEIVNDALENNVGTVLLLGDYGQRHDFASGTPTEYGSMPYDIEARLSGPPYYWTYDEIHTRGFRTGFSHLP